MWLLLLACTSTAPGPVGSAAREDVGVTLVEETIGDQPPTDDTWLFDDGTIHDIALTVDVEGWNSLLADAYTYVPASVTIDGLEVDDIGLRLRGKLGSFRTLDGKPKFKLSFNEYQPDQRFYGLKELSLNNEVVDCSYLKEPLAYSVFRALGVPAGRTSFARVTLNGLAYGFYVVIETPDDVFLSDHWPDDSGNLYDGKYAYYSDGSYALIDFTAAQVGYFQLEEGTDVGLADVTAVTNQIAASTGSGAYHAQVGTLVDWDAVHTYLAAEAWVGHNDGYALNTNNYRVYFDPADGKAELIPWDFDYGFLNDYDWGMSWSSPRGALAAGCWSDADCAAAQRKAVMDAVDTLDLDDLRASFDLWDALTLEAAQADPRRECAAADIPAYRDALRTWIDNRAATLGATWSF